MSLGLGRSFRVLRTLPYDPLLTALDEEGATTGLEDVFFNSKRFL